VFPPGAVLYPGILLPLHVFEERGGVVPRREHRRRPPARPAPTSLGPAGSGWRRRSCWGAIARGTLADPYAAERVPRHRSTDARHLGVLTHGETRVLHYLPTNLSAPEIAGELYLSVNTVRTHQRHLYQKLGARSRTQAVAQARALGLLAPSPRRC
jgi:DNA-binding CsgD family transcriptional regulator